MSDTTSLPEIYYSSQAPPGSAGDLDQKYQIAVLAGSLLVWGLFAWCLRGLYQYVPSPNENDSNNEAARLAFIEDNLESVEWRQEANLEPPDADCPICLAPFEVGDNVSSSNTKCPHIFHYECIRQWLLCKKECPLCRNEFLICQNGKEPTATSFGLLTDPNDCSQANGGTGRNIDRNNQSHDLEEGRT